MCPPFAFWSNITSKTPYKITYIGLGVPNPDRYIKLRKNGWVYHRRVPKALQHVDLRAAVEASLKTHDIEIARARRGTPQLNGKVECSHRSDEQEFYQLLSHKGDVDLEAKLNE